MFTNKIILLKWSVMRLRVGVRDEEEQVTNKWADRIWKDAGEGKGSGNRKTTYRENPPNAKLDSYQDSKELEVR